MIRSRERFRPREAAGIGGKVRGTGEARFGRAAQLSLLSGLALVALLTLAAPAQAAFPGANGKIAFTSVRDGNYEIYKMNPDGTAQTRLTTNAATYDTTPSWSPDGTKIAFSSYPVSGGNDVYTMNPDGTGVTRLTTAGGGGPAWSPDGSKIAFGSGRSVDPTSGAPISEIYTMNADGTGQTRLTFFSGTCYDDPFYGPTCPGKGWPAWSPDGTKIAFQQGYTDCNSEGDCYQRSDIFVMNSDGSGITNLTNYESFDNSRPDWSPDGTKIAFDSMGPFGGFPSIAVMNPDGTGIAYLTHDPGEPGQYKRDERPAWSPDGQKIAFSHGFTSCPLCGSSEEIYVMNADGTDQTNVTNSPAGRESEPSWRSLPTAAYPHPQSASQLEVSIVPAFQPCATNGNPLNAEHAPPLGVHSCSPPKPGSAVALVGPASAASAQLTVTPGDTDPTNGNQADVGITANLSDIQATAGGDYNPNASGADLTALTRLRLTDMANGYGGLPATASEFDFKVPIDCSDTRKHTLGATCAASTTANALIPGFVGEQRQTVVQAFRVRIDDSGPNGIRGDSDDGIFATQGVYIP
jgi:TolB protein